MTDPYHSSAKYYDRLFDGMNKGLRLVGIRMFRPTKGMRILDVGCGTGSHLELYQRYQCELVGLDSSSAMLRVAHQRLDRNAQLVLGNASRIPYESGTFDLVVVMLTLHEIAQDIRPAVLGEIKRVSKPGGQMLLIDYHSGPYQPFQGWVSKVIITAAEVAAGRTHFSNYRNFMAQGGLARLISQHGLQVKKQNILAGGTLAVFLVV